MSVCVNEFLKQSDITRLVWFRWLVGRGVVVVGPSYYREAEYRYN